MTLAELAEHVSDRVGSSDDESIRLAKRFIRRRYKMIYDQHPWRDAHTMFQFRTTDNDVIMPNWVDKIVEIRVDNTTAARRLTMVSRQTLMLANPGALDKEGQRLGFTIAHSVATHTHPDGAQVEVYSSDAADTTQEVRIRGIHNGLEIEEAVTLAGMTVKPAVYWYDEILGFSKPETAGFVTLQKLSAGAQLQVLLPKETERRHQRIQLVYDFKTGADEEVFTALVKRHCRELIHDSDAPQITNLDESLIAFGMADLLERHRQYAKSQVKIQEAVALVNNRVVAERDQQQHHIQIIPAEWNYAEQSTIY